MTDQAPVDIHQLAETPCAGTRTDLYKQGYADGRRDAAAGISGAPPAPKFEAPGR